MQEPNNDGKHQEAESDGSYNPEEQERLERENGHIMRQWAWKIDQEMHELEFSDDKRQWLLRRLSQAFLELSEEAPVTAAWECSCTCCQDAIERHRSGRVLVSACLCAKETEACDCPFCLISALQFSKV